jgi:hypothetical protein
MDDQLLALAQNGREEEAVNLLLDRLLGGVAQGEAR